MNKKVILSAPILSRSGYGEHSRQIFDYLISKPNVDVYVNILPWGITPWYLNHDDCNGLIGEALKRSDISVPRKYDLSVQVQLPDEWNPKAAEKNIGVSAVVETDKCNPEWIERCNLMDAVVVPSIFCKKILNVDGSLEKKVSVVPEHYFEELNQTPFQNEKLKFETDFNFLTVGMLTGLKPELDRKNLFYLVKWFVEEFKSNSNVGLVIKTSQGRDTTFDKKNCYSIIKKILQELNHKGNPKIYLLHGDMSRKDMVSVYKHSSIKCFISATRGEGFGLPMLEAAVAGLPVMTTDWSAHKEFLDYGKWIKLDYELKEVHKSKIDSKIFVDGAKWAEVNEQDFKKKIRKFYESNNTPKDNAIKLSNILKQNFNRKKIFDQYDEKIGFYLE